MFAFVALALIACNQNEPPARPVTPVAETTAEDSAVANESPAETTAPGNTLDPHDGMNAVAVNSDGSLKCDGDDPELKNLHQFRGWVTTPRTEYGRELYVAQPVFPGKVQNNQDGKCVDSDGNVIYADHVRWTTSTTFVAPAAPPTDSSWYDETKWGPKAEGKPTELTKLADNLVTLCFDEAGARCRPAKYESTVEPDSGKTITINVPSGTEVKVASAAPTGS